MPKIAILDDYAGVALSMGDWSSLPAGYETMAFNDNLVDHDRLAARLAEFEIVCAMRERTPFPAAMFRRLPKLKLFVTSGMRNRGVDFAAAQAMGVTCCGTTGSAWSTAELTWGLTIGLMRHIGHEDRMMKQGHWQTRIGVGLEGKTLGVLGLGRLGGRVARIGQAFDMKVIAWSRNLTQARCEEVGAELVSKADLFRRADVLTIHTVLSDRTRGLVGAAELALMRPTAYLINTSRGPIIDETALVECLRADAIAGAAVDVYDIEPLPADHRLRGLENLLMTPHAGYVTRESYSAFYTQMVENIRAWHDGAPIRLITA